MASERLNEYSPAVEADRRLLPFETWTDYLDSLVTVEDLRNLRSIYAARMITSLGYRASGDTLDEHEFNERRAVIQEVVYPTVKPYVLVSEKYDCDDPFVRALAYRERANRCGMIQSILFVRLVTGSGFEISGYIDYAHRLVKENWTAFFKYGKKLWPQPDDLSYFHWRHGTIVSNSSRNYIPVMDIRKGVLYQNRHDFKVIWPQPGADPGPNTTRTRIDSPNYTQCEILDHTVRVKTE